MGAQYLGKAGGKWHNANESFLYGNNPSVT